MMSGKQLHNSNGATILTKKSEDIVIGGDAPLDRAKEMLVDIKGAVGGLDGSGMMVYENDYQTVKWLIEQVEQLKEENERLKKLLDD